MSEIDTIMQGLGYKIRESYPDGEKLLRADESRLAQFEEEIGYRLPPDYRYFLQRHGGAWLSNVMIRPAVQDEKLESIESVHLLIFLGFYSGTPRHGVSRDDLLWAYQASRNVLPAGVIPIAEFCDDYYICISCAPETYGRVFVKVPEEFDDDDPADFLFPQAASFLEFLRSLRTMTDEEAHEWYKARGG
jgi:cell wall assembly regulator SMI1